MTRAQARKEKLDQAILTLEESGRALQLVIAGLRRTAEAEALRQLAMTPLPEIGGAQLRAIIAARRLWLEHLDLDGGDPAWALLMELFAARLEGSPTTIASLTRATGIASTTTLRWLTLLEGRGLVTRRADSIDERLVRIDLTDQAEDALRAYIAAALTLSPWLL